MAVTRQMEFLLLQGSFCPCMSVRAEFSDISEHRPATIPAPPTHSAPLDLLWAKNTESGFYSQHGHAVKSPLFCHNKLPTQDFKPFN